MAQAILDYIGKAGSYGVVTTHYQNLKKFAEEAPGFVNGAMLYDRQHLAPTFQLSIGNPGSSFALDIAYKLGLPRNVIDEAVRLNAAGIDCPLAIETSGHAALRENHFLDDGMYLVTVLIVEAMRLKQEGKELSSLLDGLREPVESVELRLNITAPDFREAGRTVIERVMDHASYETDWHIAPDNREGVRINFDLDDGLQNGWFLLRLSVHDPVLPLNVESDVPGGVRTMLSKLLSVLDGIEDIDISPIRAYLSKN